MARKNYSIDEVLKSLRRKKDIRINGTVICILTDEVWDNKKNCLITNPEKSFDLGNGSWGKIDFLTNHCNYRIVKVETFKNS